jgi:hypothetical protein
VMYFRVVCHISMPIMIKLVMKKKSLLETNPYLKDPEVRAFLIERCVASSTAIEGVHIKSPKFTKEIKKKMRQIAATEKAQKKRQ